MFETLRNARYMQYLAAITATLSGSAGSMYALWLSPAMSHLQSDDSPIGRPISDEEGSWVLSLFRLAVVPASLIAGWSVEKYGRKRTLLAAGVLLFLPWLMIIFANSIWMLYVARTSAGIGEGLLVIGCAIYNGEIAENDIRGKLGTTIITLRMVGALLILCIGPYVSYTTLAIISAIVPLLFLCLYFFMPETPFYLVKTNRMEEAENNLKILSSKLVDEKFITNRMMEIERSVKEDMKNKTTLWEFLSNKDYRMTIFVMFGIKNLQLLSGEAAVSGYMQSIIASTGSIIPAETSSVIFGCVQMLGALSAGYLVDKIGRKPLLIASSIGCAIALFAEGTYFYLQDVVEADVSTIAWLPTLGIAVFAFMINLGISTLPYVLLGEFFPANIKGIAVSASTLYGGSLAFIVSKFFKPLANIWGEYTLFWIFSSVCVAGVVFVALMLPETKGKSFSEIQALFKKQPEEKKNDVESKLIGEKSSKIMERCE